MGSLRTALVVVLVLAVAGSTAGATTSSPPKVSSSIAASVPPTAAALARGRILFAAGHNPAGCGLCHAFRAAETTSTIGPDLGDEMTEAELRSDSDAQLAQRVRDWIHDGRCLAPTDPGRCMPAGIYSGAKADSIAVFVAICARSPKTTGCKPEPAGPTGLARTGEQLYLTRGCVGCHFNAGGSAPVGPSLYGLAGSKVVLANGKTVVADDGYLTAAIAAPDAQIVKGFPAGLMSSRVTPQHLTSAEIRALVAYVKSLR
jgi:mono/diheme cytochrome c family protein